MAGGRETSPRRVPGDPVRGVVEEWQRRAWEECDLTAVDDLVADPYLRHGITGSARRTHDELKADLRQYQKALGKPVVVVHDRVVDGDKVWSRISMSGANLQTGEPHTIDWLQIHRVADGKIAEVWVLHATDVNWEPLD